MGDVTCWEYPGLPLTTERLIIRGMRMEDLEPMVRFHSDPVAMRYVGRGDTWSREFTQDIMVRIIGNTRNHPLDWVTIADRKTNEFLGMVCVLRLGQVHRDRIANAPMHEIGWRMRPEYWNKGYATEAARAVAQWAFDEQKLPELGCIVDERNVASCRVAEKIRMTYEMTYELEGQRIRFHRLVRSED